MSENRVRRVVVGTGGALLFVSLFLPWTDTAGTSLSGWEQWTIADLYFVVVCSLAFATALTGGHRGVFRADVSLIGATDLFSVAATLLIGWFLLFDLPDGATGEIGVYVGLAGVLATMFGAGEYRMPPGSWFPRTTTRPSRDA